MESSVKKSYETNELPDGGTEYVIEGTRRGAIARGRLGAPLLTLIFSFGSFGGYVFLIFWVLVEMLGMNHNKLSFWFLSIPSLILTVFTLRKIRQLWMGPGKFSVKLLSSGIEFDEGRGRLALSDIKAFGVMTETSVGATRFETSYVFADALGQQVRLTPHVTTAMAKTLSDEFSAHYEL